MSLPKQFDFSQAKREPYLDEASFLSMTRFRIEKAIPNTTKALAGDDIDREDIGHVRRQLFNYRWDLAILF